MRVLYIAGEVAPFSESTETARLVRMMPERLLEMPGFETRILMPRYGTVSERRNRLHEVIRLSGSLVTVGERVETIRIKVASIPGIRLQVYFVDNNQYFKRKGLHEGKKDGVMFDDNAERALFYARAALTTTRNLGWVPDVLHASGWIAGLVPYLVRQEDPTSPLAAGSKVVYTPDEVDIDVRLSEDECERFGLPAELAGREMRDLGIEYADAVACGPGCDAPGAISLDGDPEDVMARVVTLYKEVATEGALAA
jgi:starch synthase